MIIPTASDGLPPRLPLPDPDPDPSRIQTIRKHFVSRGARHVVFLHTRDRQVANSDQFVEVLRSAKAVFFTGGAFRVLDDTFHGTLLEREVKALLARGGILAGDSAGAITLGCFSLAWNRQRMALTKATDGLCVLPRVTVAPHIQKIDGDDQTKDIAVFIVAHPATIGINISENTILVLRAGRADAIGTGGVTIFDPAKDKTKPYVRLAGGEQRDLNK